MKRSLLIIGFLMMPGLMLIAQIDNRANIWYFGNGAGIDFNSGSPTTLTDGALRTGEGCATISDLDGQLLIYTDGSNIWNRQNEVIPGATNLGGSSTASQSSIIVPVPNAENLLYVFSVDFHGSPGGLRYAIVDMDLNGGLGGLISANNILLDRCTEKLTAVSHCNQTDFWLVAHEYGNNNYVVWEITEAGISTSTRYSLGEVHPPTNQGTIGYLKASADGSRLAAAVSGGNFFELYDFDNETGVISNPLLLEDATIENPYGVEFSPDGSRLYLTTRSRLFQVDLEQTTNAAIENSLTILAQLPSSRLFGALQLAPDGKMYVAKTVNEFLSVINNPNALGAACDYEDDAVFLDGPTSRQGLPNFIPSFFEPTIDITLDLLATGCDEPDIIEADISSDFEDFNIEWLRNDTIIDGEIDFQLDVFQSGTYQIRLSLTQECSDTLVFIDSIAFNAPPPLQIDSIIVNQPDCGENDGTVNILASGGVGPLSYSVDNGLNFQLSGAFSALPSGSYSVVVRDDSGCSIDAEVQIVASNAPVLTLNAITDTNCDQSEGTIEVVGTEGTPPYTYSLNGGEFQSSSTFSDLAPGAYTIVVSDESNCQDTLVVTLENIGTRPSILNTDITPTACGLDNGSITVEVLGEDLQYSIDGSQFQRSNSFTELAAGDYPVIVSSGESCADTVLVSIPGSDSLSIVDLITSPASCNENSGSVRAEIFGASGEIQVILNGNRRQSDLFFDNLAPGNYILEVIDELQCGSFAAFTIDQTECEIYIPNIFTPNNDGQNDEFLVSTSPDFDGEFNRLQIFNRWGSLVFVARDFDPNSTGWNGTFGGEPVDNGVYVYTLEYTTGTSRRRLLQGDITVLR